MGFVLRIPDGAVKFRNAQRRLTGDTAIHRGTRPSNFATLRDYRMIPYIEIKECLPDIDIEINHWVQLAFLLFLIFQEHSSGAHSKTNHLQERFHEYFQIHLFDRHIEALLRFLLT